MTKQKDFYESYYEHNCSVTDTEDVLKTELPENSSINKLKRWWYDWFLVSYSNEQARQYFSSFHAMRMERCRQYRKYRNRIHPLSKFRNVQNVFMFVLFLVNTVVFNHNTSMTFGQLYGGFYYLGAMMEWIIIVDVMINCLAGYIDTKSGKIILDKRLGLLHYGSTKLFVHVASALPLQCVMLLRYGDNVDCTLCKMNHFITTLKFLSIFGLFRIYEHSSFLTRDRSNCIVTHVLKVLRIYLIGMMVMLYYIDASESVTLIHMIATGDLVDEAHVTQLILWKFVNPDPPSNFTFFIHTFGRITKSVLLFNISFRRTTFYLDIIASIIGFMIANSVYLWQILECYDFFYILCFLDDRVIKLKQSLSNMARCRQLPDIVTSKLNSYYNYNQSKMEQSNYLLQALPEVLKTEAVLSRHRRLFRRIPCFSEWPLEVVEGIVLLSKEEIYLADDLVAEPWVQSEGLLIVCSGELAVYNNDMEIGHLIDGDYFGEMSLVTDNEQRTSRVVAITPCVDIPKLLVTTIQNFTKIYSAITEMLLLEKSAFRGYMRHYPELYADMRKEILGTNSKI